jgi:hypothetical protein
VSHTFVEKRTKQPLFATQKRKRTFYTPTPHKEREPFLSSTKERERERERVYPTSTTQAKTEIFCVTMTLPTTPIQRTNSTISVGDNFSSSFSTSAAVSSSSTTTTKTAPAAGGTTPQTTPQPRRMCRHIETMFAKDILAQTSPSPYGDNFYLPAHIIYESRDGCGAGAGHSGGGGTDNNNVVHNPRTTTWE